jgi:oxaloacetate decarboxylase gamma subunit
MENFELGILLLMVGMTTVFVILLIVIYLGKGLIILVNKYAPEEVVAKKQPPTHSSGSNPALSFRSNTNSGNNCG